jgi:hypothetical protein
MKTRFGAIARQNSTRFREYEPAASRELQSQLKSLTLEYGYSLVAGDLVILDGRWYVTHTGLLRLAYRNGCAGIHTNIVKESSSLSERKWTVRAIVYKGDGCN